MFPTPMIERIIAMRTDVGDTVLDPFSGSGTSLVAAANLKRKGIGIEIDKRYKKITQKRLLTEANLFNQ